MTKEEFLLSLPFKRKARLYMDYLDHNKYYNDLEPFFEMDIEEAFDENDFNSYDIINLIEFHPNYLSDEEWNIYKNLEE